MNYDVIGDIHGQAHKLEGLLRKLGYSEGIKTYIPPSGHKALFLGDIIDTGPSQVRVLEIVRTMVEQGNAHCIMGNHEFNAIAFVTDDPRNPGESLRPSRRPSEKSTKNREQHKEFLSQVGEGSATHHGWIEWFKTLPICMDLGGLRAVHGCWDSDAAKLLSAAGWGIGQRLTVEVLVEVGQHLPPEEESEIVRARKLLTCGLELPLPAGRYIEGRKGSRHGEVRIANWRHWAEEFSEVALVPPGQDKQLAGMSWPEALKISAIEGSPVFIGHHWFEGIPRIESEKLACLDWSAATSGPLVAYRWNGEQILSDDKLVWFHDTKI